MPGAYARWLQTVALPGLKRTTSSEALEGRLSVASGRKPLALQQVSRAIRCSLPPRFWFNSRMRLRLPLSLLLLFIAAEPATAHPLPNFRYDRHLDVRLHPQTVEV